MRIIKEEKQWERIKENDQPKKREKFMLYIFTCMYIFIPMLRIRGI